MEYRRKNLGEGFGKELGERRHCCGQGKMLCLCFLVGRGRGERAERGKGKGGRGAYTTSIASLLPAALIRSTPLSSESLKATSRPISAHAGDVVAMGLAFPATPSDDESYGYSSGERLGEALGIRLERRNPCRFRLGTKTLRRKRCASEYSEPLARDS